MDKVPNCAFSAVAGFVLALLSAGPVAAQCPGLPTGDTSHGVFALFSKYINDPGGICDQFPDFISTGIDNSAYGYYNLSDDTTGAFNTATGAYALQNNTTGTFNTATGAQSLRYNTTGGNNTAVGFAALSSNSAGSSNTATGDHALAFNVASNNTATGDAALLHNTTGPGNTATGAAALESNSTGADNTATGEGALLSNATGGDNTGVGFQALASNSAGIGNTAVGFLALGSNTTERDNIALGILAGSHLTTGYNNIDIGNEGVYLDNATIRIGTQGTQTATYVAGVTGTAVTGADVVVNAYGRLGVVLSATRFKSDIRDIGEASNNLMRLRPVVFRYKDDAVGTRQYGLIAEQVDKFYPELVTHGADGKIETVRYSMLSAMLLNQLQKQAASLSSLTAQNQRQAAQIARLNVQAADLQRQLGMLRTAFERRLAILEQVAAGKAEKPVVVAIGRSGMLRAGHEP